MNKHHNTAHNIHNAPQDTSMALNKLIRLTQNLSSLADREAQALAQNDMLGFSILQDEKTLVTEQYVKASEDFRSNINTYRGADKHLLNRLETLQNDLGDKTKNNNNMVEDIYDRTKARTQNALLAAQEIGQNVQIEMTPEAVNENDNSNEQAK